MNAIAHQAVRKSPTTTERLIHPHQSSKSLSLRHPKHKAPIQYLSNDVRFLAKHRISPTSGQSFFIAQSPSDQARIENAYTELISLVIPALARSTTDSFEATLESYLWDSLCCSS